jgi:RNA polymerase sigma-70 factor (ECF subfamily)
MRCLSVGIFLALASAAFDNACQGFPAQRVLRMASDGASRTGSVLLLLLSSPADPQGWSNFVERYGPKIYGWCRQRGLQEADCQDVTQEVLIQLVHKLRTFAYDPDKGSFRGWLKTVTRHAWCDYIDKRQRAGGVGTNEAILRRMESLEAREDLLQTLAETFDLEVFAEAQARVQLQVSPRDWKIFEALALEGCPGPVVAKEWGMTVTAVLTAKSRVQKKLRQQVQHLEEGSVPLPEPSL